MPAIGDTKEMFNRRYTFLNPDNLAGPGTWRISLPDEYPSTSAFDGGHTKVVAELPITAVTEGNTATVALDITQLPDAI